MPETFLSDAWFDEVEKVRAELGDPEVPAAMKDLTINIVVTGGPEGDREIRMEAGSFERGLADGAPTKLTVPFDVAKAIFIDGNQSAAMQAFMSGQIKVEGDMSKLMAMQAGGAGPAAASAEALQARLKEITA
ncbi:MAG TPA: SCP2 sterol-binding domain-containing protein [Acidimicrobiales bacterium]|nr:SCP2 sterol-binding domain-containing protein [Acidimicrobiales bacterium]